MWCLLATLQSALDSVQERAAEKDDLATQVKKLKASKGRLETRTSELEARQKQLMDENDKLLKQVPRMPPIFS